MYSGGLLDAFTGGGGGNNSAFQDQYESAPSARRANPRSEAAQLAVVRAPFNLAASPEGSDAKTGQLTDKGGQAVTGSRSAWERYLKLKPKKIGPRRRPVRSPGLRGAAGLREAVKAQAIAAKYRPSANSYFQLADFSYRAGRRREGRPGGRQEAVGRRPRTSATRFAT